MKNNILNQINYPEDLRLLPENILPELAQNIRDFILDIVATKEGHLGASLGVVELSIALHYVFNTPDDLLIWDVGHQAYVHKILTGRKEIFHTNRQLNGISGFPKRSESVYDTFGVGHSSTSISAALGMAISSKLRNNLTRNHIAVIGDASIASGMAFEGLNHAGDTDANLLVILNDNSIGIDPSVGALKNYLTSVKEGKNPKQNNMIKSLNFEYFGPIDGHNLTELLATLRKLKKIKGPKLLHIITTKGKGLTQAEENQVAYHAPGKFNRETGDLIVKNDTNLPPKFQDVFGLTLLELARKNPNIIGITPAMPTGSSLKLMMDEFPERAFDVGIAEQHAVTLAAGMATQGFTVYCNIYSTFLQRAYDQIIHDVCLQKLPVIFCLDRSGLVGEDGATHHGVFDLAYLRCIPNIIIYAPKDEIDLRNILYTVQENLSNPIAIRYPRGRGFHTNWKKDFKTIEIGKAEKIKSGKNIAIISTGTIAHNVNTAIDLANNNENLAHYHFGFIKPIDEEVLKEIFNKHEIIFTVEEGTIKGGLAAEINEWAQNNNYLRKIISIGIPDQFIEQGSVEQLHELCKLDVKNLINSFENCSK